MSPRLFVGLPLPPSVRATVAEAQRRLQGELPELRARWTEPDSAHLTLVFLGEVAEPEAQRCADTLAAAAAGRRPFACTTTALGAFPSARRPSVLWLGVAPQPAPPPSADPAGALGEMQRELAIAFRRLRDDPRPFRPHLTLARLRAPDAGARARLPAALAAAAPPAASWRCHEVVLFESRLRPQGAQHLVRARAVLGG